MPTAPRPSDPFVPLAETASWAEWWETAVSLPDGASLVQPQDTAVWQHIQAAAHIWHARQQAATSQHDGDLSVLAAELADRFGPDHLWSASRLEAYKTCGFLFFLQAVMKLEPRQEPVEGLDVRQFWGNGGCKRRQTAWIAPKCRSPFLDRDDV